MRDSRGCVPSTHRGTQPQAESGRVSSLVVGVDPVDGGLDDLILSGLIEDLMHEAMPLDDLLVLRGDGVVPVDIEVAGHQAVVLAIRPVVRSGSPLRPLAPRPAVQPLHASRTRRADGCRRGSVSYTHLTLPTILLV